jgi:hypothetical protein
MSDLSGVKPARPSQVHQDVIDIVITAHKHGASDMTAAEIQKAYEERVTNRRIKDGPFARVMFEIASAGWLLRADKKRPSRIGNCSGPAVYAYRAPVAQAAPVASAVSFY